MTQTERLARRDELRAEIAKHESQLAALRAEEAKLLDECDHNYADGRHATTGARVKICADLRPRAADARRQAVGVERPAVIRAAGPAFC